MLEAKAIGRLVADPQIRVIMKNDKPYSVCEFRLACQHRKDQVDFIKITAWRGMGDFIFNHCKKGQKIFIGGTLRIPPYDKEKNRSYEPYLVAYSFEFCDSKMKETSTPLSSEEPFPNDDDLADTLQEEDLIQM